MRLAYLQSSRDFPQQFTRTARVVKLERNYRSTQPILDACNAVINNANEGLIFYRRKDGPLQLQRGQSSSKRDEIGDLWRPNAEVDAFE